MGASVWTRHLTVLLFWLAVGLCMAGLGCGGGAAEPVGIAGERLVTLTVDAGPLSVPAGQVVVRVANQVLSGSQGVSLADGTYPVTDYNGVFDFGQLTVSGGVVVATSGAVVATPSGIGFDLTQLAAVTVQSGPLSTPASQQIVRLGSLTGGFSGAITVYLPDGTVSVTDYNGAFDFGQLTLSGGAVVSTSGAVVTTPSGVGFDLTQLAAVTVPASTLSTPASFQTVRLGALTVGFESDVTVHLPDGTYPITDYTGTYVYGSFAVAGHAVTAGSGAVVPGPGGISFDLCDLTSVVVVVAPGQEAYLGGATTYLVGTVTLSLPAGSYTFGGVPTPNGFQVGSNGLGGVTLPPGSVVTSVVAGPGCTPTCVTLQRGLLGDVADALINDSAGNDGSTRTNYGSSSSLTASLSSTGQRQGLLRFDLGAIPSGATITQATVTLQVLLQGGVPVNAHRITAPWSEATVTWESFAGAYDPAVEAVFPGTSTASGDLTALVEAWASGSIENDGILLEHDTTATTVFASSEYTQGMRPALTVCYLP